MNCNKLFYHGVLISKISALKFLHFPHFTKSIFNSISLKYNCYLKEKLQSDANDRTCMKLFLFSLQMALFRFS